MKTGTWIAGLGLLLLGAMAPRLDRMPRTIDDPVPEPVSCPLCGGDPQLHILRMFAFSDVATRAVANALRW